MEGLILLVHWFYWYDWYLYSPSPCHVEGLILLVHWFYWYDWYQWNEWPVHWYSIVEVHLIIAGLHYWDLDNILHCLVMWRGLFYSSIGSIGTIGTNGMNGQSIGILLLKCISLLQASIIGT